MYKKLFTLFFVCILISFLSKVYAEQFGLDVQAMILSQQGEYAKAIKLMNQAIKNDSKNYSLYNNRAIIKENSGDINGALTDYGYAIYLNPNYDKAYQNRMNLYIKTDQYNNAVNDCNKLVAIKPSYSSYLTCGNAKLSVGGMNMYNSAIEDFTKAISLVQKERDAFAKKVAEGTAFGKMDMSEFEGAYYGRGLVYLWTKNYDKAYNDFDMAIKCRSFNPDAYYYRGIVKKMKGYKADAIRDLNIAKQQYQQDNNQSAYLNTIKMINSIK